MQVQGQLTPLQVGLSRHREQVVARAKENQLLGEVLNTGCRPNLKTPASGWAGKVIQKGKEGTLDTKPSDLMSSRKRYKKANT